MSKDSLVRTPAIKNGGQYFALILDTSRSMRETVLEDGRSLFDYQLSEANRFVDALRATRDSRAIWVLTTHFKGVVPPGWTPLQDLEELKEAQLPESSCSPVLDILSGVLDTFEKLRLEALKRCCEVKLNLWVATDGLDGLQAGGRPMSISTQPEAAVRKRIERFNSFGGCNASALAIGRDQGAEVAKFFEDVGFVKDRIFKSGMSGRDLRRQFGCVSDSLIRKLAGNDSDDDE